MLFNCNPELIKNRARRNGGFEVDHMWKKIRKDARKAYCKLETPAVNKGVCNRFQNLLNRFSWSTKFLGKNNDYLVYRVLLHKWDSPCE